MCTTEKEKFESLWADFIALVKGKLINTVAKQKLSTPLANLILSDAASSWNSEYEINGKWLSNLKNVNSKKAELVGEILLDDMRFTEIDTQGELPTYYNYVIPAVGACFGCAISMYLEYSKLVQAASTIIPAVLLYPAVTTFRKRMNETNKDKCIEDYIAQLDKYKNSVISVLS
ncbi:MAG: hypothetical protein ACI4DK_07715 [Lachnospiraceae bacterium]